MTLGFYCNHDFVSRRWTTYSTTFTNFHADVLYGRGSFRHGANVIAKLHSLGALINASFEFCRILSAFAGVLYGADGFGYGAKAMAFCAPPAVLVMLAGHSLGSSAGTQVTPPRSEAESRQGKMLWIKAAAYRQVVGGTCLPSSRCKWVCQARWRLAWYASSISEADGPLSSIADGGGLGGPAQPECAAVDQHLAAVPDALAAL